MGRPSDCGCDEEECICHFYHYDCACDSCPDCADDCFCFEEQLLAPGERVQMPVSFYIDPDIENDMDGKFINQITLSYTFYQREIVESAAIMLENPQKVKLN
jgi:hypothetical protein